MNKPFGDNNSTLASESLIPDGYLSLKDLAIKHGYTADHIGWLARTGKVAAIRSGPKNDWYVRDISLAQYAQASRASGDYLPLLTLAQQFGYAKDYLGWLARTGKIDAIKSTSGQWFAREMSVRAYYADAKRKFVEPNFVQETNVSELISIPVSTVPVKNRESSIPTPSEIGTVLYNESSSSTQAQSKRINTAFKYRYPLILGGILVFMNLGSLVNNIQNGSFDNPKAIPSYLSRISIPITDLQQSNLFTTLRDGFLSLFKNKEQSVPSIMVASNQESPTPSPLIKPSSLPILPLTKEQSRESSIPSGIGTTIINRQILVTQALSQEQYDSLRRELSGTSQLDLDKINTTLSNLTSSIGILQSNTGRTAQAPIVTANYQSPPNLSFGKTDFSGAVSVSGNLSSTSNISASSLNISGASSFSNNLTIEGDLVVNGLTNTGNQFSVTGSGSFSSNLNVGNSLTVGNGITVGGSGSIGNQFSITGSASIEGRLALSKSPTLAHTGTWPSFSNPNEATLYINVVDPIADGNIIAYANDGNPKFLVDSEGDIYGNNLVLTGSTTTATQTVGDLNVEGTSQFGDAVGDKIYFVGTISPKTLTSVNFAIKASTSQTADLFKITDADSNYLFKINNLGHASLSANFESTGTASVGGNILTNGILTSNGTGSNSFAGSLNLDKGLHATGNVTTLAQFFSSGTGSNSFAGSLDLTKGLRSTNITATSGLLTNSISQYNAGTLTINAFTLGGLVTGNNQSITGLNQLTSSIASISTNFEVGGYASIGGNLTLVGTLTGSSTGSNSFAGSLNISKSLTATNSVTAGSFVTGGNLTVGGNQILTGTFTGNSTSSNSFAGSLNLDKGLHATGNVTTLAQLISSGTASNSFAGSLELTKGLRSNAITASGLITGSNGLTISSGTVSLPNGQIDNVELANSTISGIALGSNLGTLTFGTYLTGTSYNGSTGVTIATNATSANTISTLVARDASGNFSAGTITATTFSGALSGNATTATTAGTVTTAAQPSITSVGTLSSLAVSGAITWSGGGSANANTAYTHSQAVTGAEHGAVTTNTANMIVRRDASGNFSAGTITATTFSGALSGNATTATNVACSGVTSNGVGCSDVYVNTGGDTMTGQLVSGTSGINIDRSQTSGNIWFAAPGADTNHVLWNDYYGGPTTRGAGGSGWDGMKWNAYNGLQIRTGSAGGTERLIIDGPNDRVTFPNGSVGIGTTGPDVKLHIDNKALTGQADTAVYDVFKLSNTKNNGDNSPKGSNFTIALSRWENPGNNYPRTQVDFKTTGLTTDTQATPNTIMSFRDNGNVGIGTTSPAAKLDLRGTLAMNDNILYPRTGGDTNHKIVWENAGYAGNRLRIHEYGEILFSTLGGDRMVIQDNGYVYFNNSSAFFEADGDLQVPGVYRIGGSWPASGGSTTLCDNGGWIYRCTSSGRFKTNIETVADNWEAILDVRPVSFDWKDPMSFAAQNGHREFGVIAEEVEALGLTNLVRYSTTGEVESVAYERMVLYTIPILKQHNIDIEDLKIQIASLSMTVDELLLNTSSNSYSLFGDESDPQSSGLIQSLFESIVARFSNVFEIVFEKGLFKVANVVADLVETKKIIAEELQLKDAVTGEIYCVKIVNGELEKNKCTDSLLPTPTPSPTPESTPTPTLTPTETPVPEATLPIPSPTPDVGATESSPDFIEDPRQSRDILDLSTASSSDAGQIGTTPEPTPTPELTPEPTPTPEATLEPTPEITPTL